MRVMPGTGRKSHGKNPQYQVSVITPFHNVDMDMFRRGYKSLQCQSIGFENIQWIVVLHNTKPEIRAEVEKRSMAGTNAARSLSPALKTRLDQVFYLAVQCFTKPKQSKCCSVVNISLPLFK